MLQRRFMLSLIALVGLLLPEFGQRAEADYGVESSYPLSDPSQANIDERTVGTWQTIMRGKTYYLHVGTGNIVGKSNWMELVLVHPGDKPAFYLYHKIGFPCSIGDASFFNVTNMSKQIPQLRGSTTEELIASVARYDIFRYEVSEDYLDVWSADKKFVREAIEAGKIKGSGESIDDTTENLIRFVESSGAKLFGKKIRYTRVKSPDSQSPDSQPPDSQPPDS